MSRRSVTEAHHEEVAGTGLIFLRSLKRLSHNGAGSTCEGLGAQGALEGLRVR